MSVYRPTFISHAHADNEISDRYVEALRARGVVDVWYDRTNMQSGQSLGKQIERELAARTAFVLMMTEPALASFWVDLELQTYLGLKSKDRTRVLLPVRIGACEVPPMLNTFVWLDALEVGFERAIDGIVKALTLPPATDPRPHPPRTLPPISHDPTPPYTPPEQQVAAPFPVSPRRQIVPQMPPATRRAVESARPPIATPPKPAVGAADTPQATRRSQPPSPVVEHLRKSTSTLLSRRKVLLGAGALAAATAGLYSVTWFSRVLAGDSGSVRSGDSGNVRWSLPDATNLPVLANGMIYVGSNQGRLYALDPSTGDKRWSSQISGSVGRPAISGGMIYVSADTGKVCALDANTGKMHWSVSIQNVGNPVEANGVVYVWADAGKHGSILYALNATTGAKLWSYPGLSGSNGVSDLVVANGMVYVSGGNSDGHINVYALDAHKGTKQWAFPLYTTLPTGYLNGEISNLALANGTVCFVSYNFIEPNNFTGAYDIRYGLDARSGRKLWSYQTDGDVIDSDLAESSGVVYINTSYRYGGGPSDAVSAFDIRSGTLNWTWGPKTNGVHMVGSPVVSNNVVYTSSDDGSVLAIRANTGIEVWTSSIGGEQPGIPVAGSGIVAVISNMPNLCVFDATTGVKRWSTEVHPGDLAAGAFSLAVGNGVIYLLANGPYGNFNGLSAFSI